MAENTSFHFKKNYRNKLVSTNEHLTKLLAKEALPGGYLLQTAYQSGGKGQGTAFWESEAGKNLLFSFVLRPDSLEITRQFYLSMIVSLALQRTVKHFIDEDISIKWPNDIYAGNSKIAGILIENAVQGDRFSWVVVGAGLNVNQEQFHSDAPNPVSMKNLSGRDFELKEVLEQFETRFSGLYGDLKAGYFDKIKSAYLDRMYWRGQNRKFRAKEGAFSGTITGVDSYGFLQIKSGQAVRTFDVKEVEYLL